MSSHLYFYYLGANELSKFLAASSETQKFNRSFWKNKHFILYNYWFQKMAVFCLVTSLSEWRKMQEESYWVNLPLNSFLLLNFSSFFHSLTPSILVPRNPIAFFNFFSLIVIVAYQLVNSFHGFQHIYWNRNDYVHLSDHFDLYDFVSNLTAAICIQL